jgi:hypothetical protein
VGKDIPQHLVKCLVEHGYPLKNRQKRPPEGGFLKDGLFLIIFDDGD